MSSWCSEISPWGVPWDTVVERAEWHRLFPFQPPVTGSSELQWRVLRKRPQDVPRVLLGKESWPNNLLTSDLAHVMIEENDRLLERLSAADTTEVGQVVDEMESQVAQGREPTDALSAHPPSRMLNLLLSPGANAYRGRLLALATRQTRARFGHRMRVYAPLYLSNECTNLCTYCGFNVKSSIVRRSLDRRGVREEARALAERGHQNVLLLTGEAPARFGEERLLECLQEVIPFFRSVGIEVFPMSERAYSRMYEAGVRSVTVYQETYDPSVYRRVHRGGRKRDPLWRLATPERVLSAGIPKVGIGALLGLNAWQYEAYALVLHARALLERWPQAEVTISFPRLRPAESMSVQPTVVSDADLVHMMSVLRLLLPEVGLVLSTREAPALRDFLMPRLMTEVSAGSSTVPGGYSAERAEAGEQFSIADERPLGEVKKRLAVWGFS